MGQPAILGPILIGSATLQTACASEPSFSEADRLVDISQRETVARMESQRQAVPDLDAADVAMLRDCCQTHSGHVPTPVTSALGLPANTRFSRLQSQVT